jgi:hypothetical protein
MGHVGLGLGKLFTFGGLGIWYTIDLLLIATGASRDSDGKTLRGYMRDHKSAWTIILILWGLNIAGSIISMLFIVTAFIVFAAGGFGA